MKWYDKQKKEFEQKEEQAVRTLHPSNLEAEEEQITKKVEEETVKEPQKEVSIIRESTKIQGDLTIDDDLVIFGTVIGDITSKGSVTVHGTVEGNIICKSASFLKASIQGNISSEEMMEISEDTMINGNLEASHLIANGKVQGDAKVVHIASFQQNAHMIGNVEADEIEIQRGAIISGNVAIHRQIPEN